MHDDKLTFLLEYDFSFLTPECFEQIREEILKTLQKYFYLSDEATLQVKQQDSQTTILVFTAQILSTGVLGSKSDDKN